MHDHGRYTLLGQTVDDAAGEAFDKVGRLLGLPYPGGPAISAAARNATPATRFPRARTAGAYDFSFSGLKTAVLREVEGYRARNEPIPVDGIAAAFEEAVVDALATKTLAAARDHGVAAVALGGGVAANDALRRTLDATARGRGPAAAGAAAGVVHRQRRHDRSRRRVPLRGGRPCRCGARGHPQSRPAVARGMNDPLAPDRLAPPTPGQLRRLMGAERLRPRKSLSQNFLTDPEVLDAIVAAAELSPGDNVVEIGPGLGVLTRRLLAAGTSVTAVELDARLAEYLRRELYGVERFELIEADALSLHPREFFPGEPIKVVANIPYHITSPLLHTFLEGERPPELTVLLVQLEVAERVAAPAGRMSYLSVFAQNVATAEVVFRVPAAAFEPAPAVDSAVLVLRRRERPVVEVGPARDPFYRVVQAGFRQRRKQVHNGLTRELAVDREVVEEALAACGVDPDRRPQTLSVDEWACLTGRLAPLL